MKMKRFEPIYKEFYDLLQELIRVAHAYKRTTDIPFIPANKIQKKYLEELQNEKKAVTCHIVTKPHNFDFIELKVAHPHATIYSVDFVQPTFDKLLEECEEFFKTGDGNVQDIGETFGFEGTKFWLKRAAGVKISINFHPTRSGTTFPLALMQAFTDFARNHGIVDSGWLTTVVPASEIIEHVQTNHPEIKPVDWGTWMKYTKNNLLKKMNKEDKKLIAIKDFDKRDGGYPFAIKLPLFTP